MTALKYENKYNVETTTHLGGQVNCDDVLYIELFCLVNKIPKSKLLRQIVSTWVIENQAEYSFDTLVELIIERSIMVWKTLTKKERRFFLGNLRKQLKKKGFNSTLVDTIIKGIENGKKSKRKG